MSLQLYCPTDLAVLLVTVSDDRAIHYVATADKTYPGIWFTPKPLQPIDVQLLEAAVQALNAPNLALDIHQDFTAKTKRGEQEATIYLAKAAPGTLSPAPDWSTMPQLLREMPKDRNRLPYLLAWQVLSGGLAQSVMALEIDDEFTPLPER